MEQRILSQLINIDKVAYKEMNFKSKLIEWSQKNRVKLEYKLLEQKKDEHGSPVFRFQVLIEGLEGGIGSGFSKKESQQLASKLTLQRLRREPQFIDEVFAAKGNRTKMEEEPVLDVPSTEQKDDFLITESTVEEQKHVTVFKERVFSQDGNDEEEKDNNEKKSTGNDEFDLSDITATPKEKSREDIIAEAEAAAFSED